MKNTNYFNPTPRTLEELKKQYRELAMQHHPDMGGSDEAMKVVNAEYDALFPKLKNMHQTKNGETYERETAEAPEYFKDLINELMRFDGIIVEVIGSFIWLTGNTKPYKDRLKALNLKWHMKKSAWYLAPEDYKKRSRKNYELDEIRAMYGTSGEFKSNGTEKLHSA
jgi:curved DNA-binding protein CbpA